MLQIIPTKQFKKDLKRIAKDSKKDLNKLNKIINMLAEKKQLPIEYRDHQLKGNLKNYRECHIESDWLLMYQIKNDVLVLSLVRTGSHSDLLNM
ncbi:MAG: type II toxin-antitoxin system YafQ family toxin [Phascolarctobacterium sp.]|nr:type II toxin-antitoxin system YafQ family toxin [Phascolarctobacterium sp.]